MWPTRSLIRVVMLPATLAACGGDRATAPDDAIPFDGTRARADARAVTAALRAPALESFAVLGAQFGLGQSGAGMVAASGPLLSAGQDVTPASARDAANAAAGRLLAAMGPDATPAGAVLRADVLGMVFVYDPVSRRYVPAPAREGAPANGVRFILYALNPVTREPLPDVEVGHADLLDLGAAHPAVISLRLLVVSGGVTYLDYRVTLAGTEQMGALSAAGAVTDGTTRLDFRIEARGSTGAGGRVAEVAFEFHAPSRDFAVAGNVSNDSDPGGDSHRVALVIHSGGTTIRYALTANRDAVDATVFVNGRVFATITGDPRRPEVRAAGGRPLTAEEVEALKQLLGLADGAFALFADLLRPVGAIVELTRVP